jgi:plastocyanin
MKRLILVLLILVLAGCTQQAQPAQQTAPQGGQQYVITHAGQQPAPAQGQQAAQQPASVTVRMQNYKFVPNSITVPAGTEVIWVNMDSVGHTVTFDSLGIDESVSGGGQYSHVFDKPGTYNYRCAIHPSMIGILVVT